jgi:hypothetical protein
VIATHLLVATPQAGLTNVANVYMVDKDNITHALDLLFQEY